jgi:hypothetical protein
MSFASEAGHWYAPDGTPAYEVLDSKGQLRPATLRDARKLGLYPSVTGMEKVMDKPGLTNWMITRSIRFASENPRQDSEPMESYCQRIKAQEREDANKVRDLGSHIHGCIEKRLLSQPFDATYTKHVDGALSAFAAWADGLDGVRAEKSFGHPIGFGGRVDIHKPVFVADFKCTEFPEENLPSTWPNHARQLTACREGLQMPEARCAIIFVSTLVPGLAHLVEIKEDKLAQGWEEFKCLLQLWKCINRYDPTKETDHGQCQRTVATF